MNTSKVKFTKSGLLVRSDPGIGLLIYSPHSGLFFAINKKDEVDILNWLNKKTESPSIQEFESALGPGWAIPMEDAIYPHQNLLAQKDEDWSIPQPDFPLVINWLLTGNCPLDCLYCYAQDLMHGKCQEPNATQIKGIVKKILLHNPLAVVLTGGDPLFSPHLQKAMDYLYKKTGLILDTSGFLFQSNHIDLLRKYNVFVRVSLDSEFPKINNSLRRVHEKFKKPRKTITNPTEAAINLINNCVENKIKVGVQTVVTKKNCSDLVALGDKLYRIGVCNWRIMMIAPSRERYKEYLELRGNEKRYYSNIEKQLQTKHRSCWDRGMSIQLIRNSTPNAVVLVSPEGNFYTESNIKPGKEMLDEQIINSKQMVSFKKVNMHAQTERYLNLKGKRL